MNSQEKRMEDRATRDEDRLSRKVKRLLNGLSGFRKHQILQLLLVVVEGFEVEREILIRELDDKDHVNKMDFIKLLRKFDIPTAEFDFAVDRNVIDFRDDENTERKIKKERVEERPKSQATSMKKTTCNETLQHPQPAVTEFDRNTSSSEDDLPPPQSPVESDRDASSSEDDLPPPQSPVESDRDTSSSEDNLPLSRRLTVKSSVEFDRVTSSSEDDLPPPTVNSPVSSPSPSRASGKRRRIDEKDSNGKFRCPYSNCSKVYTCPQNVDRHVSEAHLKNATVHWCPHQFCMYSSVREHDVLRHYKRLHEAKRPQYKCILCGRRFVTSSNMYRHIETSCPLRKKQYSDSNDSVVP